MQAFAFELLDAPLKVLQAGAATCPAQLTDQKVNECAHTQGDTQDGQGEQQFGESQFRHTRSLGAPPTGRCLNCRTDPVQERFTQRMLGA